MIQAKRDFVHAKFGGRCAYCGLQIEPKKMQIEPKKMQIDHILPKFKWGTDDLVNLHPACASCNNWKHSFSLEEFRSELEAQPERLRKYHASYRIGERFGLVAQTAAKVVFYFERIKAEGSRFAEQNSDAVSSLSGEMGGVKNESRE